MKVTARSAFLVKYGYTKKKKKHPATHVRAGDSHDNNAYPSPSRSYDYRSVRRVVRRRCHHDGGRLRLSSGADDPPDSDRALDARHYQDDQRDLKR
jgi:hypothetical protein